MNAKTLLDKAEKITVWRRGGQWAPNKPLLLLYALARIEQGKDRLFKYAEVHEPLGDLLREFGPPRKVVHPEFPFWRLKPDDIWQVEWPPPPPVRKRRTQDVSAAKPLKEEVEAGFPPKSFGISSFAAWRKRCGVCGFDVQLGGSPLAPNAAHIRWKLAGGPGSTMMVWPFVPCTIDCSTAVRSPFSRTQRRRNGARWRSWFPIWRQAPGASTSR